MLIICFCLWNASSKLHTFRRHVLTHVGLDIYSSLCYLAIHVAKYQLLHYVNEMIKGKTRWLCYSSQKALFFKSKNLENEIASARDTRVNGYIQNSGDKISWYGLILEQEKSKESQKSGISFAKYSKISFLRNINLLRKLTQRWRKCGTKLATSMECSHRSRNHSIFL